MFQARPSPFPHPLLGLLLLWMAGACGPVEAVHSPGADFVPPVLLSVPHQGAHRGLDLPDPEAARVFREAAQRLRAQLHSFLDTLSSGPGSYPAARCCAGELSHLLVQARRWEGGMRPDAGVVPVLIRLATEPGMEAAPLLADSVVAHALGRPLAKPPR